MSQENIQYELTAWSLADLFAGLDAPEIEEMLAELEGLVVKMEGFRDVLMPALSPQNLCQILDTQEHISRLLARLGGMGSLSFSANTQDQVAQNFMARMGQLRANTSNRTIFFSLWWKELDEENASRLLENAGIYRYFLETLRLQTPYTLSEVEEKVINLKDVNGVSALRTIYQSITNRYTFRLDGIDHDLTRGELTVYFRDPDPAIRAAAAQELFRVYAQDENILGQIYQYIVRDWHSEYVNLRGFKQPISLRNLVNQVSDEVVDTLLDVYAQNRAVFHRYFRLKAKKLGMDKLSRTDVYAPVTTANTDFPYDEGVKLVLQSFDDFDRDIGQMTRRVFADNHIDSEVRKGKRGGAFCATINPDLSPWVLMSYQGQVDDVATLAHELGHAIHAMLAEHHNQFNQQATLPLAETASTFSEMLVVDRMLTQNNDPTVHESLLFKQMDDGYAVIARQAGFARFERAAHDKVLAGASVAEISDLYLAMLQEEFGDSVDIPDEYRYEWLVIPHIYSSPFYVYAYAFGQLLVLALYQQFKQEGDSFIPRYKAILAAGGSDAPERILGNAGIHINDPKFWQGGFDVLADLVEQLEAITETK